MVLTIASMTTDRYLHLHTKLFLHKYSIYLVCEGLPVIQMIFTAKNTQTNN